MTISQRVEKLLGEIEKVQPMNNQDKNEESIILREFFREHTKRQGFCSKLNPEKHRKLDVIQTYGSSLRPSYILDDDLG
jgi:hypothetical protein